MITKLEVKNHTNVFKCNNLMAWQNLDSHVFLYFKVVTHFVSLWSFNFRGHLITDGWKLRCFGYHILSTFKNLYEILTIELLNFVVQSTQHHYRWLLYSTDKSSVGEYNKWGISRIFNDTSLMGHGWRWRKTISFLYVNILCCILLSSLCFPMIRITN